MIALRTRPQLIGCAAALFGLSAALAATDSPQPMQPSVWQHHEETTSYFGMTTRYTCEGLESRTKQLLLYFGARSDLKVKASCADLIRPVDHAVVHTDFYTLSPASTAADQTVQAHWVEVVLRPRQPAMDMGDCEFVDQMKPLLTKDFSVRDLNFDTACTAHSTTIEDYRVSAQVLKLTARR